MSTRSEWMKGSVGLSVHWTTHSVMLNGEHTGFEEAVNRFDVPRFAEAVQNAGAKHIIFTLAHAKQYLAFPNAPLEALLPGRTAQRDLIGEILDAMKERGIRCIAYYNHSCNGEDDTEWKNACGYAAGGKESLDWFAQNICDIVAFTARRYGKKIDGWWFDSAYSVDPRGPHNTISCDLGEWPFPWANLIRSARSGNPECAVSINAGIGEHFLYAPDQDYYAGETVHLDEVFTPEPDPQIQDHRWICIDNAGWVFQHPVNGEFSDLRFSMDELTAFVWENLSRGRMTTFNVEVDQTGSINPKAVEAIHCLSGLKE